MTSKSRPQIEDSQAKQNEDTNAYDPRAAGPRKTYINARRYLSVVSHFSMAVLTVAFACATVTLLFSYPAQAYLSKSFPRVQLNQGTFVGNETHLSTTFFGNIPYAEPPVGNLRFAKPQQYHLEIEGSQDEFDARDFGSFCLQQPARAGVGSEDCLTLNIWKPSTAKKGDKLPVFFYIHGGGLNYGASIEAKLGDMVEQSGNIVGVNINYRLNTAGFLVSQDIVNNGTSNAGLWDQRAALEWVQRNIEEFGGNPDSVTIGGESAGAAAVLYHMFSNGGNPDGLFHAGILSSISTSSLSTVEEGESWVQAAGAAVACDNSTSTLECLRESSEEDFRLASNAVWESYQLGPTFDDFFIPDLPSILISQGKFAKIPIMAGHTTYDAFIMLQQTSATDPAKFGDSADAFWNALGTNARSRLGNMTGDAGERVLVEAQYPPPEDSDGEYPSQWMRAGTALTDAWFGCLDWLLVNASLAADVNQSYLFLWDSPDPSPSHERFFKLNMAVHASDLFYLWEGFNLGGPESPGWLKMTENQTAVARESRAYWASFVETNGNSPNSAKSRVNWTSTNSDTWGRIVITPGDGNETATIMQGTPNAHIERCRFWSEDINWKIRF